ncbi:MAG: zinc-binding dehydrogenase [Chloroflexota bacterium]
MKAAVLHKLGEAPKFEDFPDPIPQGDQDVLVHITAASIKNIDKGLAAGSHYDHYYTELPCIVGIDGAGILDDGTHVLAGTRPPYGMMAEKAIAAKAYLMPIPEGVDDVTAAALPNPAISAWMALTWRGQLKAGQTVFIMGATGVTGKLAIQLAKHFGAGRVVAAGRNSDVLQTLPELGADAVISLAQSDEALKEAFAAEARQHPFDIVLDFLWGHPSEVLLDALTGHSLVAEAHTTRYIEIGEMAGSKIALSAATLRSAGIELYGQGGGSVPSEMMARIPEVLGELLGLAAAGKIRIDTEAIPLRDIEQAWQRDDLHGKRIVIIP